MTELNVVCDYCGKRFHMKPSKIQKSKTHHCSKDCFYKAKKQYMLGPNNHQYGLKGRKNSSWKSDQRISSYGYVLERCPDHPLRDKSDFVLQHRLVAEKYLLTEENSIDINGKRYLKKEYVVHHKNHKRTDNRVCNLEVMTHNDHQSMHSILQNICRPRNKKGQFMKEIRELSGNDYQKLAARTINNNLLQSQKTLHALHGLSGEVGEINSLYQKAYQGHVFDEEHEMKEIGDLLWFVAELCTSKGYELEEIMRMNIDKLKARFPEGFETERSINRAKGDI